MKDNGKQKTLGSAVTVALADYFQVSLDEIVGRINPNSCNDQSSQQNSNCDVEPR